MFIIEYSIIVFLKIIVIEMYMKCLEFELIFCMVLFIFYIV